jgi:hypothetical protein
VYFVSRQSEQTTDSFHHSSSNTLCSWLMSVQMWPSSSSRACFRLSLVTKCTHRSAASDQKTEKAVPLPCMYFAITVIRTVLMRKGSQSLRTALLLLSKEVLQSNYTDSGRRVAHSITLPLLILNLHHEPKYESRHFGPRRPICYRQADMPSALATPCRVPTRRKLHFTSDI